MPSVTSGVAVALLWKWIFNPEFGIANAILNFFGFPGLQWLNSPTWAMPALIIMSLWGVGGGMLIYLAGLQGIPGSFTRQQNWMELAAGRVLSISLSYAHANPVLSANHGHHRLLSDFYPSLCDDKRWPGERHALLCALSLPQCFSVVEDGLCFRFSLVLVRCDPDPNSHSI